MTRRVDGLRIDTPRLEPTGREAQNIEALRGQPVRRRHIDAVHLKTGRSRETGATEQPATAEARPSASSRPTMSVDDLLAEFVAPQALEPAVLSRSVSILRHCIADLVPNLDGGEQLHELATALMEEEIERQCSLLDRMQEGFEPG